MNDQVKVFAVRVFDYDKAPLLPKKSRLILHCG
jgi:hypothetical protein